MFSIEGHLREKAYPPFEYMSNLALYLDDNYHSECKLIVYFDSLKLKLNVNTDLN